MLPCSSPFSNGAPAQAARSPSPVQSRNTRALTANRPLLPARTAAETLPASRLDGDQVRLEEELDLRLQQQVVVHPFEHFGPDGHVAARAGAAGLLEPPLDLGADAAGQHVHAVGERHEQRQHAGGAHAAQAGVAFGEEDAGPLPGRGHGRRHARRPAAGHEHVHLMPHRDASLKHHLRLWRLGGGSRRSDSGQSACGGRGNRPFQEFSSTGRHGSSPQASRLCRPVSRRRRRAKRRRP